MARGVRACLMGPRWDDRRRAWCLDLQTRTYTIAVVGYAELAAALRAWRRVVETGRTFGPSECEMLHKYLQYDARRSARETGAGVLYRMQMHGYNATFF